MARWYVVRDRDIVRQVEAPDRDAAMRYAPEGCAVQSVCEWEEIAREVAALKHRRRVDFEMADRAVRMDFTLQEAATGQREAFGNTYPAEVEADIRAMAWNRGELMAALRGECGPIA